MGGKKGVDVGEGTRMPKVPEALEERRMPSHSQLCSSPRAHHRLPVYTVPVKACFTDSARDPQLSDFCVGMFCPTSRGSPRTSLCALRENFSVALALWTF